MTSVNDCAIPDSGFVLVLHVSSAMLEYLTALSDRQKGSVNDAAYDILENAMLGRDEPVIQQMQERTQAVPPTSL